MMITMTAMSGMKIVTTTGMMGTNAASIATSTM